MQVMLMFRIIVTWILYKSMSLQTNISDYVFQSPGIIYCIFQGLGLVPVDIDVAINDGTCKQGVPIQRPCQGMGRGMDSARLFFHFQN